MAHTRRHLPLFTTLALGLCVSTGMVSAQEGQGAQQAQEAAVLLQRGNVEQAIQILSDALGDRTMANDRRAIVHNDRGIAYWRLGNTRAAIDDFNRAVTLYPEYAVTYNNRGNVLLALGQYKEAIKDFDRALVLAPVYAAAFTNRATALLSANETERALVDYARAIEITPANAAAFAGRARAQAQSGRHLAAIRDLTRTVAIDGRLASAYRRRAESRLALDQPDEAIEDLSRAIAFEPRSANFMMRGEAYLNVGNALSAIKDFNKVIELDVRNALAYANRGLAHAKADATEEALNDLAKAIELDPRLAKAYAVRAWVYKVSQQPELGQRDVERALKLEPVTADSYWAQGEIEEAFTRKEPAAQAYARALGQNPRHKDTLTALERLGLAPVQEEAPLQNAGLARWRIIQRGQSFQALSEDAGRFRIPLEMMASGQPRLIEWDPRPGGQRGVATLRYVAGIVESAAGVEEIEAIVIVDTAGGTVLSTHTHKRGQRTAIWAWEDDRVVIQSADGYREEVNLRAASRAQPSSTEPTPANQPLARRQPSGDPGVKTTGTQPAWSPWGNQGPAGGSGTQPRPAQRQGPPPKQKTLFDMIFGN